MRRMSDFDIIKAAKGVFAKAEEATPMNRYTGLFTLFAGVKTALADNDDSFLASCKAYLDKYPDGMEHPPHYSFDLYRVGGNAKAYLFMNGEYEDAREDIRKYAELTYDCLLSDDGIVCYRDPAQKYIWVDAIAAVAPFMLFSGIALGEQKYIDFAAVQSIKMYDAMLDPSCGLVNQTRGLIESDKNKKTEDHWSRGNGWMMVAFAELIEHLEKTSVYYDGVVTRYKDFCRNLIKYQSMRGMWRQEITLEGAWEESSGTGLIAYGIGVGIRMGILSDACYKESFEHAVFALANYCITDKYNTYNSCEANNCPGEGSEKGTIKAYITIPRTYRNEPHGFGCIMMALQEAYKNGITTVKRYEQLPYMMGE